METKENIIKIRNLCKFFGPRAVLDGLTLDVADGENLVVMGKSGSGKTVLIKCMVGLMRPDSGELLVMDKDVTKLGHKEMDELRLCVGFLFQSGALYDSMSVRENLEFPLRRHKREKGPGEIKDLIEDALESVGLADAIDKMPAELSGGMRKRIGLARTIILNPKIILYDEPTTGLDPITAREISELIVEVRKKYKSSSVVITHDIPCARITADRIIMLNEGKIAVEGTFDELMNSDDKWVSSFFDDMRAGGFQDKAKPANN